MARISNTLFVTSFVALIFLVYTTESFTPTQRVARVSSYNIGHNIIQLHAAEDDSNGSSLPPLPSQKGTVPKVVVEEDADAAVKRMREDWAEPTSSSITEVAEEEGTSYPIDLPSPVLLGLSMVLAISSIGSLFELTSGSETLLGFAGTAALAAIGAPLALFFIYAAILKGAAETEEDDRKFNSRPRKL